MMAADEIGTVQPQAASPGAARRRWHFARHYLEMVAAMMVGMLVIGGAARGVVALAGLDYPEQPEVVALLMATEMSIGMVAWMRHRGHGWAGSLEMTGAMYAPLVLLFPLVWLDAVASDDLMMLEHTLMLPLMLLVMLRRRDEYSH